jgi:hypothetical protein
MSALGQKRTNRPGPKSDFARYCPKADNAARSKRPLCAISGTRSEGECPPTEAALPSIPFGAFSYFPPQPGDFFIVPSGGKIGRFPRLFVGFFRPTAAFFWT